MLCVGINYPGITRNARLWNGCLRPNFLAIDVQELITVGNTSHVMDDTVLTCLQLRRNGSRVSVSDGCCELVTAAGVVLRVIRRMDRFSSSTSAIDSSAQNHNTFVAVSH